jgi:hypothetical protein
MRLKFSDSGANPVRALNNSLRLCSLVVVTLLAAAVLSQSAFAAINRLPDPDPQPGSYGIEATKPKAPPEQGASLSVPVSGASFTTSPIAVSGICPDGLLVQVHNNGVMVGAVMCENGSFSLDITLFSGVNEITAHVYDELNQTGPVSNIATVNYTNAQFTAFGELITLTSQYGRRSAMTNSALAWPLQLSGGTGPYAFSIDWGDGSPVKLASQSSAGNVNVSHSYSRAGIYTVNIRVVDTNGVSAFLRTVAVSNGKVDETTDSSQGIDESNVTEVKVLWEPIIIAVVLLVLAFWLGRRSQTISLRSKMERERDNFNKQNK